MFCTRIIGKGKHQQYYGGSDNLSVEPEIGVHLSALLNYLDNVYSVEVFYFWLSLTCMFF